MNGYDVEVLPTISRINIYENKSNLSYTLVFSLSYQLSSSDAQYSLSSRNLILQITIPFDLVLTFGIDYAEGKPSRIHSLGKLALKGAQFSCVNDRQMIGATACSNYVALWSITSQKVLKKIMINNITAISFDEEINSFFVGLRNSLIHYTINGHEIRRGTIVDLNQTGTITVIKAFGFGFQMAKRFYAIGYSDGYVRFVRITEKGEIEWVGEKKVSYYPIQDLKTQNQSYVVKVYDILGIHSPNTQ